MGPGPVVFLLSLSWIFLNELFEDKSTIMPDIMCGVDECKRSIPALLFQRPDKVGIPGKFLFVPLREFLPFCRVMSKPLPQVAARCYLPHPEIEVSLVLFNPPRP